MIGTFWDVEWLSLLSLLFREAAHLMEAAMAAADNRPNVIYHRTGVLAQTKYDILDNAALTLAGVPFPHTHAPQEKVPVGSHAAQRPGLG